VKIFFINKSQPGFNIYGPAELVIRLSDLKYLTFSIRPKPRSWLGFQRSLKQTHPADRWWAIRIFRLLIHFNTYGPIIKARNWPRVWTLLGTKILDKDGNIHTF